jgi:hypothetical protein
MLTQLDDDERKFVMAYVSWSNNKIKAKYNLYEGECLVVWVVLLFMCYIYNSSLLSIINHSSFW